MKFNRVFFSLLILCLAVAVITGCKKASGSRPGLVKASGTVSYKGAPIEGAILEFYPAEDAPANSNAAGRTDEKGVFNLMTDKPGDGVLPGKYKVVVKKTDITVASKPAASSSKGSGDKKEDEMTSDKKKAPPKNLLPEKYSVRTKTPLEIEIPAKGASDLKINLED